jgi:O-antigen/teichoic acid export membrane protein
MSDFFSGSMVILFGLIAGKLVTVLNNVVLARNFDPFDYGIFLLALSIFELINVPASLGLPSLLPKYLAQGLAGKESCANRYFSLSMSMCLIASLLLSVIFYIFTDKISWAFSNPAMLNSILIILAFAVPITTCNTLLVSVFRGYRKTLPKIVIQDILSPFLRIAIFLVVFASSFCILSAPLALFISNVIILLFSICYVKVTFNLSMLPRLYDSKLTKQLLYLAWPLTMQSMIVMMNGQVDRLALGVLLTPKEVGIYGTALSISMILSLIPSAFNYLALPIFAKTIRSNGRQALQIRYKGISEAILLISLPLFIFLTIVSDSLITLLYGEVFKEGSSILWILNVGVISIALLGPSSDALVAAGKTRLPFYSTGIGLICNVILNFSLIPVYKLTGAAISFTVSLIITRFLLAYYTKKYLNILPLSKKQIIYTLICIFISITIVSVIRFYSQIPSELILMIALSTSGIFFILLLPKNIKDRCSELLKRKLTYTVKD